MDGVAILAVFVFYRRVYIGGIPKAIFEFYVAVQAEFLGLVPQ